MVSSMQLVTYPKILYNIGQSIQENEWYHEQEKYDHTINMLGWGPHQIDDEYSSSKEGFEYDVNNQRYNVNMGQK